MRTWFYWLYGISASFFKSDESGLHIASARCKVVEGLSQMTAKVIYARCMRLCQCVNAQWHIFAATQGFPTYGNTHALSQCAHIACHILAGRASDLVQG